MSTFRRLAMTAANSNGISIQLPAGYRQLLYIQSTGTQYLAPDIYPTTTMRYQCGYIGLSEGTLFGSRKDMYWEDNFWIKYNRQTSAHLLYTSRSGYAGYTDTGWQTEHDSRETIIKHLYIHKDLNERYYKINSITKYTNRYAAEDNFTSQYQIYLFALNHYNNNRNNVLAKIYYFKAFDKNGIEACLIPCYRTEDDTTGMYDIVSNTFYTNQGTGEFIKGPEGTFKIPDNPER